MKKIIVSFVLVLSLSFTFLSVSISAISPIDIINKIMFVSPEISNDGFELPVELNKTDYPYVVMSYCQGTPTNFSQGFFFCTKLPQITNYNTNQNYYRMDMTARYVQYYYSNSKWTRTRFDSLSNSCNIRIATPEAINSWDSSKITSGIFGTNVISCCAKTNFTPTVVSSLANTFDSSILNGIVPNPLDQTTGTDDIDEDSKDKFLDFIPFDITGPDFSACENPIDYVVTFVKWAAASSVKFGMILFANLKIFMDNITKFPAILINYTKDMIKALFIPSDGFLESRYVLINNVLNNKFVFIKQISDFVTSFYIQFQFLTATAPVISFTYDGISHTFIDFSFLDDYIGYIRPIIAIALWIPFLIKMYKRIPTLINSIPQDD